MTVRQTEELTEKLRTAIDELRGQPQSIESERAVSMA
jgi:hypothetical protein